LTKEPNHLIGIKDSLLSQWYWDRYSHANKYIPHMQKRKTSKLMEDLNVTAKVMKLFRS
jgi:hypothetical protein